jgi:hypothetical protein
VYPKFHVILVLFVRRSITDHRPVCRGDMGDRQGRARNWVAERVLERSSRHVRLLLRVLLNRMAYYDGILGGTWIIVVRTGPNIVGMQGFVAGI